MGQAKQRGNYDQRKREAIALKKAKDAVNKVPYSSSRVALAYAIGLANGLSYMDPRKLQGNLEKLNDYEQAELIAANYLKK